MKTGKRVGESSQEKYVHEFYICLLGLEAVLKRVSLKDAILFIEHNPSYLLNHELFDSGICFNLFSEYGVGKNLKPLIINLLHNSIIEYEEFKGDIFYEEIIKLVPELDRIKRTGDILTQEKWMAAYCTSSLVKSDSISRERLQRLFPLFAEEKLNLFVNFNGKKGRSIENKESNEGEKNKESEESKEDSIEIELCLCKFCEEFRKYTYPKDKHINSIISDVIYEIDRECVF